MFILARLVGRGWSRPAPAPSFYVGTELFPYARARSGRPGRRIGEYAPKKEHEGLWENVGMDCSLTTRERLFLDSVLSGSSLAAAARAAGYSERSARYAARSLMARPRVRQQWERLLERAELDDDSLVRRLNERIENLRGLGSEPSPGHPLDHSGGRKCGAR